jgi:hypothetical protein
MTNDLETRLDLEWRSLQAAVVGSPLRIIDAAAPDRASRRAVLIELEDVRWSCRELEQQLAQTGRGNAKATREWTAVQVAAHLAAWAKRTREELESLTANGRVLETIHFEPIASGGPRTWNQREVDARQDWTAAMVFDEIDSELTRVADIVVRVPEDQLHGVFELPRTSGEPAQPWRYSLAAMLLTTCRHTRYHLKRLAQLGE